MFGIFVAFQAGGAARSRHHIIKFIGHLQRQSGLRRLAFAVRFYLRHVGHRTRGAAVAHPATFIPPRAAMDFGGPAAGHAPSESRLYSRCPAAGDTLPVRCDCGHTCSDESGLPGEGKDVAVKISVSHRGRRFSTGLVAVSTRAIAAEILPEHFIPDYGWQKITGSY